MKEEAEEEVKKLKLKREGSIRVNRKIRMSCYRSGNMVLTYKIFAAVSYIKENERARMKRIIHWS